MSGKELQILHTVARLNYFLLFFCVNMKIFTCETKLTHSKVSTVPTELKLLCESANVWLHIIFLWLLSPPIFLENFGEISDLNTKTNFRYILK